MSENTEELNAEMSAIESEHADGATFEEYEAMWVVLTEKKGWSPSRAHGYLLARLYNRLYGQCEALKAKVDRLESRLEIDHAWSWDEATQDVIRYELSPEERETFPDGIACRDASLALVEGEFQKLKAKAERQAERIQAMKTALKPISFDLSIYDENDPDDAAIVLELTLGDLRRARAASSEQQP